MLLLVHNLHEKRITIGQDGRIFGKARALCHCVTITLVLHKKCTRFQPIRRA